MLKEVKQRGVSGNDAVLDCLRLAMEKAKQEQWNYIAITATTRPDNFETMLAGVYGMEMAANTGLDVLKRRIVDQLENCALVRNPATQTTADHVIFNLSKVVANFDILHWLITSEMTRVREGAPGPLKVQWFHGNGNESCLRTPQQKHNFEQILRPALMLIGAVEEELGAGRLVENCSLAPAVEACRNGESVPLLAAPKEIQAVVDKDLGGRRPVTITLREAEHYKHRNSNPEEWFKFARYLEDRGEKVLFIRDTAKAMEPIPGAKTCPAASIDLLVRAAVYGSAKANLFVANGPVTIAMFMYTPWLLFNEVQNEGTYKANTEEGWLACTGIRPGEQFPWSGDKQRIIWQADTFEVMRDAWETYIDVPVEKLLTG